MVRIDKEKCISCGSCEAVTPELFEMKDNKAHVKKQPESEEEINKAKEAIAICPVEAISFS